MHGQHFGDWRIMPTQSDLSDVYRRQAQTALQLGIASLRLSPEQAAFLKKIMSRAAHDQQVGLHTFRYPRCANVFTWMLDAATSPNWFLRTCSGAGNSDAG